MQMNGASRQQLKKGILKTSKERVRFPKIKKCRLTCETPCQLAKEILVRPEVEHLHRTKTDGEEESEKEIRR
jgi:hypothetical protein